MDKGLVYVYDFQTKQKKEKHDWDGLIKEWKKEQQLTISEEKQNQPEISTFRFYFTDNINFLKIYDKRDLNDMKIYDLNKLERDIFLACTDVISFPELKEKLSHIPDFKLNAILDTFEQYKILYREGEDYLSLPLNYRILTHKELQEEHKPRCYSSEIQQIL